MIAARFHPRALPTTAMVAEVVTTVTIENGALVITAKRENFGGMAYTSARMKTQGLKTFRFGRIEARMKLPNFMGAWPAFWMLGANLPQVGWPASGEIDIMEHVNAENRVYGTIHWQDATNQYASYGGNTATTVTDWHVYAVEWDTNTIRWFVDGNKYHEVNIANGVNGTDEFQKDFFNGLVTSVVIPGIDRQRADLRNNIAMNSCKGITDYPLTMAIAEAISVGSWSTCIT